MGKIINSFIKKIDLFQQKHKATAFFYAIIKKYGEDSGGYQAAVLTYYGFLSLFPLLLVATSVLEIVFHNYPSIRDNLINHTIQYFPVVGQELQSNIHDAHRAGFVLVFGLLIALWGAKGVADVFQYSLNQIWYVPRVKRPGFPKGAIISFWLIFLGGFGLITASLLSSFAASIDKTGGSRIISTAVSILILYFTFRALLDIALVAQPSPKSLYKSAIVAAIGMQVLQIIGGYLITHELSKLQSLYGIFAVALGLLFWIYLQARVVIYAIEVGVIYDKNLWPRSIRSGHPTEADHLAQNESLQKEYHRLPMKLPKTKS